MELTKKEYSVFDMKNSRKPFAIDTLLEVNFKNFITFSRTRTGRKASKKNWNEEVYVVIQKTKKNRKLTLKLKTALELT